MVIVSAARFETAPLLAHCADCHVPVTYIECGVGIFPATVCGEESRALCAEQEVLFVGTGGTFADFSAIEIVRGTSINWLPTARRLGLSYAVDTTPQLLPIPSSHHHDLPTRDIICAPDISKVHALPDSLQPVNCVENIEAYAFLRAIIPVAKTIDVILAITNTVGEKAHGQWQHNHQHAALLTAEYVGARLQNL